MPTARVDPWWGKASFDEFNRYGYVISGLAFADEVSIRIALQPGDPCLAGSPREGCRRAAYEQAEKAIATAMERYDVRSIDIRLIDLGSVPMEFTLELSLAKKVKT